jgi:hypothetical protein
MPRATGLGRIGRFQATPWRYPCIAARFTPEAGRAFCDKDGGDDDQLVAVALVRC